MNKEPKLTLKDYLEIWFSEFIDYDNEHHCFRHFVLGFLVAVLIYNAVILCIVVSMKR